MFFQIRDRLIVGHGPHPRGLGVVSTAPEYVPRVSLIEVLADHTVSAPLREAVLGEVERRLRLFDAAVEDGRLPRW